MESLTGRRWTDVMTTNLIIGGTGKTGRRVASLLQDGGLPVTSLSRPAFDWTDRTTWSAIERPADSAYVTFVPDLAFPGAPETVAEAVDRMARAGVRRIVLLSGRGEAEAQRAEALLAEVAEKYDASWGVVRCAFFMQNFDESLFAAPLAAGHLAFTAGDVREPFVDLADVAEVAVAVMTGEAPANRVYELTGPRLMTFTEATAEIAAPPAARSPTSRSATPSWPTTWSSSASRPRRPGDWSGCSPTSSTATTPTWPMVCGRRWGVRPPTSPTMPAVPRPPGCGAPPRGRRLNREPRYATLMR